MNVGSLEHHFRLRRGWRNEASGGSCKRGESAQADHGTAIHLRSPPKGRLRVPLLVTGRSWGRPLICVEGYVKLYDDLIISHPMSSSPTKPSQQLTADLVEGRLMSGSRLPTEQEMVVANRVSRTVVREAVAALRANGLVVVRQGVGAFVAANVRRPFRIDVDGLRSLRQALDVMELRMGIEIEAAGL